MQLIGLVRLGRDAEVRTTPAGKSVANLALAYNYGRKGDDGNRPSQWIDGSLWGDQATALAQYLTKGKQLCVTINEVHIEEYQNQSTGEKRSKFVGIISNLEFAGNNASDKPAQSAAPAQRTVQQSRPAPNFSDMDDDIPF